MNSSFNQLDYIINIQKFQNIQDDIAKATDMAVIAIDYKGNPVTEHSCCSEFCQKVRKNQPLAKLCEKCDSRGGLEAARDQDAYIYLCHMGVVDIAIPIVVNDQYLGAIMAGQVRIKEDNDQLERIVSKKYQKNLDEFPELNDSYNKLPIMPIEKIEAVAHMINNLMNHIICEAALKNSLYEANQRLQDVSKKEEVHLYYEEKKSRKKTTEPYKLTLLKPALTYINENYKEKIYMDNMAYLCNISPGYFSKIFKRETGENFSNYVNIVKLNKAKELLETTNEPVINISLDLGFEDCGYFIKVFKKYIGETPAHYRSNFYGAK